MSSAGTSHSGRLLPSSFSGKKKFRIRNRNRTLGGIAIFRHASDRHSNNRHAHKTPFDMPREVNFSHIIRGTFSALLSAYVTSHCLSIDSYSNLTLLLLWCSHVSNLSGDKWRGGGMDYTGTLMIITLKVISVAMDYQDGLLPPQQVPLIALGAHYDWWMER